ncbi:MAG: 50S ribosomal protein L29 [Candidatus Taylorbacteria bacterium RIFCSPLOWO2_12_FULL_43_20]|uniref:Large ribosomal subunit protein uL29 n=1 Tax=Candidatus Taylorbacteria bacterium RIFCSPLOWO2_12_FULL_43_20 TaxID=1802332 RepID=A0A1G2P2A5_9BACT|nr:MAG: 50S ribosomal protein L29 [Candidatus Taylorbacteria bacterium RIFCSPHIGHO2_01_FULL_43_120]OHA23453.1 MAG: 50S ribosomal protein L29 [Candidatus Taylorbacteria bacterium RIFCSPHIGHO2_02_FULL_43_55]OHA29658.1 MAG: 50S ribosomal protein L29 [Candidatus Taylorbacteria bacterium RIFCSPHIGHO2_12_FULL_42_34]OHA31586.1 MAG: 50S ribosomal protein L29 [Candidatus Taylorbacteria bacterium RIFCSPLOWO2_01_FULL_43_83]OHA38967.1 MAG: 50S ribosomal protein L29 [Candidatus Taylorbacteria bacterium RIFC
MNISKELKKKKDDDLKRLLDEKRSALREFRFKVVGSKQKNVKEGRGLRRHIAKVLTEINARKKRD